MPKRKAKEQIAVKRIMAEPSQRQLDYAFDQIKAEPNSLLSDDVPELWVPDNIYSMSLSDAKEYFSKCGFQME